MRSVLNGGNDNLHNTAKECEAFARRLIQNDTADPLVNDFFSYFVQLPSGVGALWDCSVWSNQRDSLLVKQLTALECMLYNH